MPKTSFSYVFVLFLTTNCAGSTVGEITLPLDSAIQATLDEGCDQEGHTVSIQGARLENDRLYIQYERGHGCDVHTPQVCTDETAERPLIRYQVRDVTEDVCNAAAFELIALDGVPEGLRLISFGRSAVEAEIDE